MNCLKNTLLIIKAPAICTKNYERHERNENKVYLIKDVINKMKKKPLKI